ncbi:hypothetical protein [Fusibacter bizertensis]
MKKNKIKLATMGLLIIGVLLVVLAVLILRIHKNETTDIEKNTFSLYDRLTNHSTTIPDHLIELEKDMCYLITDGENQLSGALSVVMPAQSFDNDVDKKSEWLVDAFVTLNKDDGKYSISSVDSYNVSYIEDGVSYYFDAQIGRFVYCENNALVVNLRNQLGQALSEVYHVNLTPLSKAEQSEQNSAQEKSAGLSALAFNNGNGMLTLLSWTAEKEMDLLKTGNRKGILKLSFDDGLYWEGVISMRKDSANGIVVDRIITDRTYLLKEDGTEVILNEDEGNFHKMTFTSDMKGTRFELTQRYEDHLGPHRITGDFLVDFNNVLNAK